MTQNATLHVYRGTSYADRSRAYIVVLDGTEVGRIRAGESFAMTVSPGEHQVFLKIDWCRSNMYEFVAQAGSDVTLNCGSNLAGWRIFLGFLYISLWRDQYLWIREGAKMVSKPPKMMPPISKRTKLVVLIVFVIFALSFVIEPVVKTQLGLPSDIVSSQAFGIMKVVGILLSIFGLLMPWFTQRLLSRDSLTVSANRQEFLILLFGYLFLISPVIYGLILFTYGLPLTELYFFIGASVIMGVGWGTYNYVKG